MSIQSYTQRLKLRRSELETRLDLYEARSYFGFDDVDDGTAAELRGRISEVSRELSKLEGFGRF